MENRRVLPGIFKGYPESLKRKDREERDHTDPMYKPEKAEAARDKAESQRDAAKESKLKRSYSMDEVTVAQLLKGHPQAQEILDELNKGRKTKNESGEEFQDGSEDTIGSEGHASVARQSTVHDGAKGGDNPGVKTKKASIEDSDLEKSHNFTENDPDEFEDGLPGADGEDDSGQGPEDDGEVVVGKSIDDLTIDFLIKTMGEDKADEFLKAIIGGRRLDPGQVSSVMRGNPQAGHLSGGAAPEVRAKAEQEKKMLQDRAMRALKQRMGTGGAEKSEGEADLEKAEPTYHETDKAQEKVQSGQAERERKAKAKIAAAGLDKSHKKGTPEEERAEWAKDPEGERREHKKDEEKKEKSMEWSLDFSKSVLENMGLEKGSPSVSKKVSGGGRATQIRYGADKGEDEGKTGKPETRYSHPKSGEEKRYRFEPKKGEVTVRSRKKGEGGEKGEWKERKIGAGEQEKLKNASEGGFDLHKALDEILEKKRPS